MYPPFENSTTRIATNEGHGNVPNLSFPPKIVSYPLQNLARMFLISHFLTPTIITILLFNGSNPQRTLNACLGRFELNFVETSTDLCTLESASPILKIGCWMAYSVDSIKRTGHLAFHGLFFLDIRSV